MNASVHVFLEQYIYIRIYVKVTKTLISSGTLRYITAV